jgi:Na+/H+ antiporter NhaD/arsenite permease-like protein
MSGYLPGTLCLIFGGISFLWMLSQKMNPVASLKRLDWDSTLFIASIFILVGILVQEGWMEVLADSIHRWAGSSKIGVYLLLSLVAIGFSAFIDNIPFIIVMMPVVKSISLKGGFSVHLLLFALLIGACMGGNITPVGASANIVATGLLHKRGENVSFRRFVEIGLPFTLAAVIPALAVIWFLWA